MDGDWPQVVVGAEAVVCRLRDEKDFNGRLCVVESDSGSPVGAARAAREGDDRGRPRR